MYSVERTANSEEEEKKEEGREGRKVQVGVGLESVYGNAKSKVAKSTKHYNNRRTGVSPVYFLR